MTTPNPADVTTEELVARAVHGVICRTSCGESWTEYREEADAVLAALSAAGRLLPEGGTERVEWAYPVWRDGETVWIETWLRAAGSIPRLSRRTVTEFPNGYELVGPWSEVTE